MLKTYRYEEIASDLRLRIKQDEFEQRKLPSERVLMAQYSVHRSTVRQALSLLSAEGAISSSGTRRSFVNTILDGPTDVPEDYLPQGTILVIKEWNEASTALESLLSGLTQALADSQLSVQYFDSRPRQGRTINELPTNAFLIANNIVGITLWPQSPADIEALQRLRSHAPLVLVDRQVSGFETHSVVFDDFHGARSVTAHLLQLGHQRIGFLADEVFAETVQQRWRGHIQALEAAGIVVDSTCFALFQGIDTPNYRDQMVMFLKGAGQRLTAVVCSNDTVALGFLHFLQREEIRIPADVAVTGFGNLLPNSLDAMRLTTVLQSFEEVGRAVGSILLKSVSIPESRRENANFEHIEVPVQLVIRASTGETPSPLLEKGIGSAAYAAEPILV